MRRHARAIGVAGAMLLASGSAAAEPADADRVLATELFNEAHTLMAEKSYDLACAKFVESHRLDPGGGTILNAALCHELAGKTATAWAELTEAIGWARRDHRPDREATASAHREALEANLSRLTIVVPPTSDVPDLIVMRDGSVLGRAAWGSAVPIDPGPHWIEASAPGRVPWTATVELGPDGAREVMEVPALALAAPPPVVAPAAVALRPLEAAPPPTGANVRRRIAIGTLAAGTVSLAIGTVFGLRALAKRGESDDACHPVCRADAVELNDQARTAADVSTVALALAIVGIGVGTYLFVTSSRSDRQPSFAAFAR